MSSISLAYVSARGRQAARAAVCRAFWVWPGPAVDKPLIKRCLRRRHVPRRHGVRARAAAFFLTGPGWARRGGPRSGEEAPMRIALVAGTDVADAEEQRGLAAALRDAGQQVSEHAMDAEWGADVRAAVPGFAVSLASL